MDKRIAEIGKFVELSQKYKLVDNVEDGEILVIDKDNKVYYLDGWEVECYHCKRQLHWDDDKEHLCDCGCAKTRIGVITN